MCLLAALLVAFAAALWALLAGWHPLVALAVYSLSGSVSLVAFTVLLAARRARPPAAAEERLHPLAAPQRT
jgi:hypothetical protein